MYLTYVGNYRDIKDGKYNHRGDEKSHERCGDKGLFDTKRMVCFDIS